MVDSLPRVALAFTEPEPTGIWSQFQIALRYGLRDRYRVQSIRMHPWQPGAKELNQFDPHLVQTLDAGALRAIRTLQALRKIPRCPVVAAGVRRTGFGFRNWFTGRALRNAAMAVAYAPSDVIELSSDLPTSRILPIRPGVEPRTVAANKAQLCAELGLSPTSRLIVSVGRFDDRIGFQQAAWAFDVLKYEAPDLHLILIGDGPARPPVEEFSRALGGSDHRVRFLGFRPDATEWVASAEMVWMLRPRGGLNAILEAMAQAKPVLAARSPESEFLIRDGETGWLVPREQPVLGARRAAQLLKQPDERIRVGQQAREFALNQFPPQAVAEQLAQGYDAILARNPFREHRPRT